MSRRAPQIRQELLAISRPLPWIWRKATTQQWMHLSEYRIFPLIGDGSGNRDMVARSQG
jgi:hypothetical protein